MKKMRTLLLVAILGAVLFSHVAMASASSPSRTGKVPTNVPTYEINLTSARKVKKIGSTVKGHKCYDVTSYEIKMPFIVEDKCVLFARSDRKGAHEVCRLDLASGKLETYPLINKGCDVRSVVGDAETMYWVEYDDFNHKWYIVCKPADAPAYVMRQRNGRDNAANTPQLTIDGEYLVWMESSIAAGSSDAQNRILVMDRTTEKISELAKRYGLWHEPPIEIKNGIVAFTDRIDGKWIVRCFDVSKLTEIQHFTFGKSLPEYVSFDGKQLVFTILRGVQPSSGTLYTLDYDSKKLTTLVGGSKNDGHSLSGNHILCFNLSKAGKPSLYCADKNGAFSLPKVKHDNQSLSLSLGMVDGHQVAMIGARSQTAAKKSKDKPKHYLVVFRLNSGDLYTKGNTL